MSRLTAGGAPNEQGRKLGQAAVLRLDAISNSKTGDYNLPASGVVGDSWMNCVESTCFGFRRPLNPNAEPCPFQAAE